MKKAILLLLFAALFAFNCRNCGNPTCTDGIQNGNETGVDCGGPDCSACIPTISCSDGIQNGSETGIDCGGPDCAPCPSPPTCADGEWNQDETDVDCGGTICSPCPPVHIVNIDKELVIRDLAVVNDPALGIGHLIKDMAASPSAADMKALMLSLLTSWETPQTVNTFSVPARTSIRTNVIEPWKDRDGQAGVSDAAWNMDFSNAPFRLLAITNRIDLHKRDGSGNVLNAGEGRFVYGVTDNAGAPIPFTVIFEYELPANTDKELSKWAKEWHHLGNFPAFNAAYVQALKDLTIRFTGRNIMPAKPNGNAINQIRTNEIALAGPWELREFNLDGTSQVLVEVTRKQNPDQSFQNTNTLRDYINTNEAAILAETHFVDNNFNGSPFLSGNVLTPFGFFWNAPGISNNDARHLFSKNTCNGCHGGETGTVFLHVENRTQAARSNLSGFMTGITINDPVTGAVAPRSFNDLSEREAILDFLAGLSPPSSAIQALIAKRANRVH